MVFKGVFDKYLLNERIGNIFNYVLVIKKVIIFRECVCLMFFDVGWYRIWRYNLLNLVF